MIVHVVLNSHLDPIWLWNLEQGIDAALATARTACDILDDYPEAHITRGEAWFYETVARHDPATFRRLLAHVAAGRLHPVGGWYVQPDCNLAAPETYRLHAEVALPYFRDVLGARIRTGYNVDSFGHGAFLPDFYNAAGIRNYVMMRPQAHEKELPGEVFRWRSPSGAELLTARIQEAYSSNPGWLPERMARAAGQDDGGIGHALFFCGVGDHGGGPAREEVDYIVAHRRDFPGVEFRFSHPDAFFDAVRSDAAAFARLPVVEGELQHHAIGCYSAHSRFKRALRSAETLFHRSARRLAKRDRLDAAKSLLFATFHDLLAGTAVASAYPSILNRLGAVCARAEDAEIAAVRRRNAALPRSPLQRIVVDNFGSSACASSTPRARPFPTSRFRSSRWRSSGPGSCFPSASPRMSGASSGSTSAAGRPPDGRRRSRVRARSSIPPRPPGPWPRSRSTSWRTPRTPGATARRATGRTSPAPLRPSATGRSSSRGRSPPRRFPGSPTRMATP